MRTVLNDKEWSAQRWAEMAGTSPTNITRFLSQAHDFTPSLSTVAKLAKVAGSSPNLVGGHMQEVTRAVPIYSEQALATDGEPTSSMFITGHSYKAIGYRVEGAGHPMPGIRPGDLVVLEDARYRGGSMAGRPVAWVEGDRVEIGVMWPTGVSRSDGAVDVTVEPTWTIVQIVRST